MQGNHTIEDVPYRVVREEQLARQVVGDGHHHADFSGYPCQNIELLLRGHLQAPQLPGMLYSYDKAQRLSFPLVVLT